LRYKGDKNNSSSYTPPNPNSVVEEYSDEYKAKYSEEFLKNKLNGAGRNNASEIYNQNNSSSYTPPNPNSIVEEGQRVDKNGKSPHGWDIKNMDGAREPHFTPSLPDSVVDPTRQDKDWGYDHSHTTMNSFTDRKNNFNPPNPDSIVEERFKEEFRQKVPEGFGYNDGSGIQKDKKGADRFPQTFTPPNPDSIVEELNEGQLKAKEWGWSKTPKSFDENADSRNGKRIGASYTPPNPDSVVQGDDWGYANYEGSKKPGEKRFTPCLPDSVLCGDDEEFEIYDWLPETDEPPSSIVASKKAFIGKRNHQTEKPTDVIRFLLKYWSDEGDTILDPTMGSGSTGVACKELKRNFIGIEFDKDIYERAVKRVEDTIEGDCLEAIDCPIAITATIPKKKTPVAKNAKKLKSVVKV
jgi:hypothetical protein